MNILTKESPYLKSFTRYLMPLLIIGILSRTFIFSGLLYYIVPALLIISILIYLIIVPKEDKNLFAFFIIMMFPVYAALTTLWSLTPIVSIQRGLYALLLYAGLFSSIFIYRHILNKKNGLDFLLPANIIIVVISMFSLLTGIPDKGWTGGNSIGFMGFAGHQNTFAAAILFTLPGIFALRAERPVHGVKSQSSDVLRLTVFILLIALNLLLLTLSYSRAALLALAIGIIAYLFFTKSKKILLFLFAIFMVTIVLYSTIPLIQNSLNFVLSKDNGGLLDRRTILWKPSMEAAKTGGLFGLGYGVSAPGIKTPLKTGSHYEDGIYIREKGNSVLALIEETGFAGLLLFLLPIMLLIKKFKIQSANSGSKFKIVPDHYTLCIVHCTLIAMFVHAQFEGWWVGVGSISLPLFLIFLFTALFQENYKSKELI